VSKKKEYEVSVPVVGVAFATVLVPEDATDDDIFEAAVCQIMDRPHGEMLEQINFYKHVIQGNFWFADEPSSWSKEVVEEYEEYEEDSEGSPTGD
jgi:hypothetical protein